MGIVRRWLIMTVLSFSGGIIFLLPYLREVYYRPLADALSLTNTEMGVMMSVFGAATVITYFPGGWVADRFSARKLITISLITTGAAGLYFATFPGYLVSIAIHAFWGVNISLLFWGAMIRVTRGWAPAEQQGRAFGILETMRGIGELGVSSALVLLFVWLGSGDKALSVVTMQLSLVTIALGVLAWFVIEDTVPHEAGADHHKIGWRDVLVVLRMPVVWMISLILLATNTAYWASFSFTPYASDVFLMSVAVGATIGVGRMWLKPVSALAAGFVADRFGIALTTTILMAVLVASFAAFSLLPGDPALFYSMLVNGAIAAIAIFALRGIYFALLEEGGVPIAVTGTATGVVSGIGFTTDAYIPYISGVLLDAYPGVQGYQYFFMLTAASCAVGFVAALVIYLRYVRPAQTSSTSDTISTSAGPE